jgi:hypothetical protein
MSANRSKTYLLPLLNDVAPIAHSLFVEDIDTYLYDENGEHFECIIIVQPFAFKTPEYLKYEHDITESELFVKAIDIGQHTAYVLKFPQEYIQEYYSYIHGKYSEFGNDAKELILKFWAEIYKREQTMIPFLIKIKQILYKEEKLRKMIEEELAVLLDKDQELGEVDSVEDETFKIKNYQNT